MKPSTKFLTSSAFASVLMAGIIFIPATAFMIWQVCITRCQGTRRQKISLLIFSSAAKNWAIAMVSILGRRDGEASFTLDEGIIQPQKHSYGRPSLALCLHGDQEIQKLYGHGRSIGVSRPGFRKATKRFRRFPKSFCDDIPAPVC